jgi:hypothetical protein
MVSPWSLVVSGWLLADYTSDGSLLQQAAATRAEIHFRNRSKEKHG